MSFTVGGTRNHSNEKRYGYPVAFDLMPIPIIHNMASVQPQGTDYDRFEFRQREEL